MTTLTQLIEQYCPDGVEYVKLGDVAEVGTGKCDRKNATDDGEYPFFVRSEQVLRNPTYQFDEEAIIVPGEGSIGEIFHYINGKYALHQRAYRVHFIDEGVSARYALYAFKTFFKNYVMGRAVTATVTSLRKPMFTEFQFPFPPREVQDAIVERLDAFAALLESLDSEIALREKRFAYFRKQLLAFDESEGVEYVKLGGALKLKAGRHIKASEISNERSDTHRYKCVGGNGVRGFVSAHNQHGAYAVIGRQGALCGNVRWFNGYFYATEHAVVVTPEEGVCGSFMFHQLVEMNLGQYATKSAQPGLSVNKLNELPIPLPSLKVQQEIADRLDTMQSLIDNLKKERELRKAQFEYYREKLLTFNS